MFLSFAKDHCIHPLGTGQQYPWHVGCQQCPATITIVNYLSHHVISDSVHWLPIDRWSWLQSEQNSVPAPALRDLSFSNPQKIRTLPDCRLCSKAPFTLLQLKLSVFSLIFSNGFYGLPCFRFLFL